MVEYMSTLFNGLCIWKWLAFIQDFLLRPLESIWYDAATRQGGPVVKRPLGIGFR